jgi:DNA-binding LacI/PurR family transcriptional regulator
LKGLANYLQLSSATVSMVINNAPGAKSIPQRTQERVKAAARELNYSPNFMARSLRQKRSFAVGVIVPEISEGYETLVMSGIEDYLLSKGYFYYVVSHRHRKDLIEEYPRLLHRRGVEGLIAVDTECPVNEQVPVVAVSGHRVLPRVTNIELDHNLAATLAIEHLCRLGHRNIAFIKGQVFSSDTELRFNAIRSSIHSLGLSLNPQLVAQLEGESSSPELGFRAMQKILATKQPFTALFAFNDVSAIGAMRALAESGLRIPRDVSVVGFDDIQSATFQNPALTTVRQPLREMGIIAAKTLLSAINSPTAAQQPKSIMVKPELIVRDSTLEAPASAKAD